MIIVHNTQISNTISHGEYLAVNNVWKGIIINEIIITIIIMAV